LARYSISLNIICQFFVLLSTRVKNKNAYGTIVYTLRNTSNDGNVVCAEECPYFKRKATFL